MNSRRRLRVNPAILLLAALAVPSSAQVDTKIPSCMLSYRFGPQQYVVIVEKASQSLFVYSNYQQQPIEKFQITTGKEPGQKFTEGDMKTPEGIYFFTRLLSGGELPKADDYGEKAFVLNYPNPIDQRHSRDGSGIWLHGAFDAEKTDNPNNSRGCVVMKNHDLVKVSKYIFLNQTPIVIYEKMAYETVEKLAEKRERFIRYLTDWKTHWENKNIKGYIGFYEEDFYYNGMNISEFKAYKERLNEQYRFIKIILSKINLYAYRDYYVVMFHQLYISDLNHFYHQKIQYWQDHPDQTRITDEISVKLPPITKFEISTGNYISLDEFRRDYLRRIKASEFHYKPGEITLKSISTVGSTVKLLVKSAAFNPGLRIIPVLLLKNGERTEYKSLAGISLKDGIPQGYSQGITLKKQENVIHVEKEREQNLKSLTLFVINKENEFEQIITYFVNK